MYAGGGGSISTGIDNISIGSSALEAVATGTDNVAIGTNAAQSVTNASDCVAIGSGAMQKYADITSGGDIIAIGANSAGTIVEGGNFISIGNNAGYEVDSSNPGYFFADGIMIGNNIKLSTVERGTNSITIGNGAQVYAQKTIQLGNTSIGNIFWSSGTYSTFSTRSDERIKEDIEDANLETCLTDINRLPVKRFKYRDFIKNEGDVHQTGFIAQDFEQVFPKAVTKNDVVFDDDGETLEIPDCRNINLSQIIPTLVAAVQELSAQVNDLKTEIAALKTSQTA
jgi:hypothetical protein